VAEIAIHAFVSGRVQRVWFRQSTKDTALSLGLTGWIRNLSDGRVELVAAGEEQAVRQLEAWLSRGPKLANVAEVVTETLSEFESFTGFEVRS